MTATAEPQVTNELTFEVAACNGEFGYKVVFTGAEASKHALAFLQRQVAQHLRSDGLGQIVYYLLDGPDELISPELAEFLWPTCEHGMMSSQLCSGPQHYLSYDQERALFG